MKYAFVNNMEVKKIEDTTEELAAAQLNLYQTAINIDGMDPEPEVGWHWDYVSLYKYIPNITARQIRLALILSGYSLGDITAALNSLPEPTKSLALTEWEYSTQFERRNSLVEQVGFMLGLNHQQLDDLWIMAGSIT